MSSNKSVYDEVISAVIALAQAVPSVYGTITRGAMPPDNGITITPATGAPVSVFMDKNSTNTISLVCNGKHSDHKIVVNALAEIHDALTRATDYPSGDGWQILNIDTLAAPSYIGQETSGQWLYGSSLRVRYYNNRG